MTGELSAISCRLSVGALATVRHKTRDGLAQLCAAEALGADCGDAVRKIGSCGFEAGGRVILPRGTFPGLLRLGAWPGADHGEKEPHDEQNNNCASYQHTQCPTSLHIDEQSSFHKGIRIFASLGFSDLLRGNVAGVRERSAVRRSAICVPHAFQLGCALGQLLIVLGLCAERQFNGLNMIGPMAEAILATRLSLCT